jgi:hypothetical protein
VKKNLFKGLLIFSVLLFWSCSNEVPEEVAKPVTLNLTIIDGTNNDAVVAGADVYLFDNAGSFDQSSAQNKGIGFIDNAKTDNEGKVILNVEQDKNYYVFVQSISNGIVLTNEESNIGNLPKNLSVSLKIRLKATNGTFQFYSLDPSVSSDNINVSVIGISLPTRKRIDVSQSVVSIPSGVVNEDTLVARYGTYKYQAQNAKGCVWTDIITIKRGEFKAIELKSCERGSVEFDISNTSASSLNISIDGINLGNLISVKRFDLDFGTHTYYISGGTGTTQCVWTNTFTIDNAQRNISIDLDRCR